MKQMLKGTSEILFAIFTFAGSSGTDDTMLALARAGMSIRGVLDPGQAAQDWAAQDHGPPLHRRGAQSSRYSSETTATR